MKKMILFIWILLLFFSCQSDSYRPYTYQPPENINDGFAVGSLTEVNIDPGLIEQAVDSINLSVYKEVHSMLIYKDGKLVFEEYFKGHKHQYEKENHHGDPVTWDSVAWNSVAWNSVAWNSVAWNSVGWNSVAWNSVTWND